MARRQTWRMRDMKESGERGGAGGTVKRKVAEK